MASNCPRWTRLPRCTMNFATGALIFGVMAASLMGKRIASASTTRSMVARFTGATWTVTTGSFFAGSREQEESRIKPQHSDGTRNHPAPHLLRDVQLNMCNV
jgi:hypothetical protein